MNETDPANVPPEPTPPAAAPLGGEMQAAPVASSTDAPTGTESGAPSGSDPNAAGEANANSGEGGERRRRRRRRGRGRGRVDENGNPIAGEANPNPAPAAATEGAPPPRERHRGRDRGDRGERGFQHPHPRHGHDRGGRHGRPGQASSPGSSHHAMLAVRALAEMAQGLLRVEGVDPLAMPRYLELQLRVPLDGGNDLQHAAGTAVAQILQRVREVREHERALRPGAVYSYFAGSSDAEGCRPTEPRHVFDGYSSTGKPVFSDFVTMAIERKDPNIDRLLAGEELILTRVTMGRVLRTQQLAEFGNGSPVFKILGQVDAGLFRVLGAAGKCAFSFQLLRGTTLEGRIRLRLHAVGAVDPMDLADPALMQILSRFQRQLDAEALRLQGQSQQGEVDEEAFVLPLLNDLARQLQNRTRNAGRRTQHGLERSEAGQRPTSRAYPDAGEANDASILWDTDQSTVVVLGGKGRVHVFSPHGKHITSVMMQGSAIDRRRHMGRWRLAEPEERGEFRIHIKRLVASGQDTPQEESGNGPLDAVPPTPPPAGGPAAGSPRDA